MTERDFKTIDGRYGRVTVFANDVGGVGRSIVTYGEWAENELSFIRAFIPEGATVLDVGAFIGTHTLAFARFVGPQGRVVAIEPQAEAFALLEKNVTANRLANVVLKHAAAADHNGVLDLRPLNTAEPASFSSAALPRTDLHSDQRPSPQADNAAVVGSVTALTIDSLKLASCALIKIDAEGFEDLVISGAEETIRQFSPLIYAECNSVAAGLRTLELLRRFGLDVRLHVVDAFNAGNFFGASDNMFASAREVALVGATGETLALIDATETRACEFLMRIEAADDLVLGMLNKPQYPTEVLEPSAAARSGGDRWLAEEAANRRQVAELENEREARARQAADADAARARVEAERDNQAVENRLLEGRVAALDTRLTAEREQHEVALESRQRRIVELQDELNKNLTRLSTTEAEVTRRRRFSVELQDQLNRARDQLFRDLPRLSTAEAEVARRRRVHAILTRRLSTLKARLSTADAEVARRRRLDAFQKQRLGEFERSRGWRWLRRLHAARLALAALGWRAFAHPSKLRHALVVGESGLFDEAYYRRKYPDIVAAGQSPLAHFVLQGAAEGRNPNPLFDTAWYLNGNPDVARSGANPLLHYALSGAREGRDPHPLFSTSHYVGSDDESPSRAANPLLHYFTLGGPEGRSPHPLFDPAYYLAHNPDVGAAGVDPLSHFVEQGADEGRNPHPSFDVAYYRSLSPDVVSSGINPLIHYSMHGAVEGRRPHPRFESAGSLAANPDVTGARVDRVREGTLGAAKGRARIAAAAPVAPGRGDGPDWLPVKLSADRLNAAPAEPPTVVCVSHVMPWPCRAGNEYRIYRMWRRLHNRGFRVIPIIAPLPGQPVASDDLRALADQFSNAILCDRDGRLEYVLTSVPDVLASLSGDLARPIGVMLDEDSVTDPKERALLDIDRTFCHDALVTTLLRLHQTLGRYVLLAEYIWMSRVLPLITGDVLKVIDTVDVFSTKHDKVVQFGIEEPAVDAQGEARRLERADVLLAIQSREALELRKLAPGMKTILAGVDFDVHDDPARPVGRRILYVASDNPLNKKGLDDFFRFAWPRIRHATPDAELLVVGRICSAVPVDADGVVRLGMVEDLQPLYREARVVINPAVAGTGLAIKTLEALCRFRRIVVWPNGAQGLSDELAALCTIVHDWYEFSERVIALLAPDVEPGFSAEERAVIVRSASPDMAYSELTGVIETFFHKPQASHRSDVSICV
jgi:FkbM family methyltransferase